MAALSSSFKVFVLVFSVVLKQSDSKTFSIGTSENGEIGKKITQQKQRVIEDAMKKNDPCFKVGCKRDGKCLPNIGRWNKPYVCACLLEYTGTDCEQRMPACKKLGCLDILNCITVEPHPLCVCKQYSTNQHLPCTLIEKAAGTTGRPETVDLQNTFSGMIPILVTFGVISLLSVISVLIHLRRLLSRRSAIRRQHQQLLSAGKVSLVPPPDFWDIHKEICCKTFCCQTHKRDAELQQLLDPDTEPKVTE